MKIYQLKPIVENSCGFGLVNRGLYRFVESVCNNQHAQFRSWPHIEAEVLPPEGLGDAHEKATLNDFVYLPGAELVISGRARDCLADLLAPYAELLPIYVRKRDEPMRPSCLDATQPDQFYYIVHVMREVDALDEEASDIRYCGSTKTICDIKRFVFRREVVSGVKLFRVSGGIRHLVFADEQLCKAIAKCSLVGLRRFEVWSD